eukprot:5155359-Pyramimonas_sp.AAC.1
MAWSMWASTSRPWSGARPKIVQPLPKPLQRQANDAHQALKIIERRLEKAMDELDSARDWVAKKRADVVKLQT